MFMFIQHPRRSLTHVEHIYNIYKSYINIHSVNIFAIQNYICRMKQLQLKYTMCINTQILQHNVAFIVLKSLSTRLYYYGTRLDTAEHAGYASG